MSKQGWIDTGDGGRVRVNDDERRQWVENDEGLHDDYRRSRLGMREYVRQHRAEIDEVIRAVVSGGKPAHYLKYGG